MKQATEDTWPEAARPMRERLTQLRPRATVAAPTPPPTPPQTLIELPWPAPPPAAPAPVRCLIELRQPDGAAMTITLEGPGADGSGPAAPDLAALVRAFRSRPA